MAMKSKSRTGVALQVVFIFKKKRYRGVLSQLPGTQCTRSGKVRRIFLLPTSSRKICGGDNLQYCCNKKLRRPQYVRVGTVSFTFTYFNVVFIEIDQLLLVFFYQLHPIKQLDAYILFFHSITIRLCYKKRVWYISYIGSYKVVWIVNSKKK